MDPNPGLPPEILVLCTTTETKDQAVELLHWIRHFPGIGHKLAREPAIPAICSLIASEQLGNTVVTERRAQQWSQSTPEHFRAVMGEVQRLLFASRSSKKERLTIQMLVDEFCPARNLALGHMLVVEKAFGKANGMGKWRPESESVQLSIFLWACRQFKIQTFIPVENIQQIHCISASDFTELQILLDEHCLSAPSVEPTINSPKFTTIKSPPITSSPQPVVISPSASHATTTPSEGMSSGEDAMLLEGLAHEFGLGEDVIGGMRFLEKVVREREGLNELVNWDSPLDFKCKAYNS
ncbi:hypothetical protein K439DRAFT_594232 [Ramaria rubella]|nr:hypothetical protein K439DRAFT_594232 [Ramaria rubella]